MILVTGGTGSFGHAFAARHQAGGGARDLVAGGAAQLPHALGEQVEAVHIGLRKAAARRVGGQAASQLEGAPRYRRNEWPWGSPGYGRSIYDYYGVPMIMPPHV